MKKNSLSRRFDPTPYILLLPVILFFAAFTFFPFVKTVVLSFALTDKRGNVAKWVGLSNYIRIFQKPEFWKIVGNTFKFAFINLFFTFSLAMLFALISTRKTRGSKVCELMYSLPMAIASAPAACIWTFLFRNEGGLLNIVLGTNYAWTQNLSTALISVSIVTIWMNVGSSFIFFLVGFRNVSQDLIESSLIDGAGPLRRVWSIILPIASPQIFFVLFLNITTSFKAFAQINLMTQGGPNMATTTLVYEVYKKAIVQGRFETGCVYAITLFIIIFIITRIQFYFENRMVHYQ